MWCAKRIIHVERNKLFECIKRKSSNLQMGSISATMTSGSKIERKPETAEAFPSIIDVNKYVDSELTIESIATKPQEASLSFEEIPGPRSLFLISKFWNSIPKLDSNESVISFIQNFLSAANFLHNVLSWGGNKTFFGKFFRVYGPVVRLHGPFHSDIVLLSRPEHARQIFQQTDAYPIRSCLDCIEKYRLDCEKYDKAGSIFTNACDSKNSRETVSHSLLKKTNIYQEIGGISDLFIERILTHRNTFEEVEANFDVEIYRWYLESLFTITLNAKVGFLDSSAQQEESESTLFLCALKNTLKTIEKCEYGLHLWKFMETPSWKVLVKDCEVMDNILSKYVNNAVQAITSSKQQDSVSFLQRLAGNQEISRSDIQTILMDMVLIGTAAVTHTIAFTLYHLSRNKRCQKKLRQEIRKFGDNVSLEDIEHFSYLNACIKEVLRLNPPVPILSRVLTSDVIIMDYSIPKNTRILFANHLNSQRDDYFEEARKFIPERWISGDAEQYNTYATIPFGHVPRSSLAKEFAENGVAVLIFKIIRKFSVEYEYGDIQSSHKLLATPTKPLKFRFINN